MPAFVAIPMLAPSMIGAGAAITGAALQSRANNKTARLQADAAHEALRVQDETNRRAEQVAREQQDYERRQIAYQEALAANKERARAPYVDLSNRSMSKMADLLGMPGWAPPSPSSSGFGGASGLPPQQTQRAPAMVNPMNYSNPPGSDATLPAETVTLMAPTGETRRVPKALAQEYVSRGARVMA